MDTPEFSHNMPLGWILLYICIEVIKLNDLVGGKVFWSPAQTVISRDLLILFYFISQFCDIEKQVNFLKIKKYSNLQ